MQYNTDKSIKSATIFKDAQVHARVINDILILPHKQLLITASGDGTCKVFDLTSLKTLKRLSFRQSLNELMNYPMRSIRYDKDENVLYTLQAPMKGSSYVTKWSVDRSFDPISSIQVSHTVASTFDYDPKLSLVSVADSEGYLTYINADGNMNKIKSISIGENMIRSVSLIKGSLISGSVDNFLKVSPIYNQGMFSLTLLSKLLFIALLIYYIYMKKKDLV